jgi:hypothetical protein
MYSYNKVIKKENSINDIIENTIIKKRYEFDINNDTEINSVVSMSNQHEKEEESDVEQLEKELISKIQKNNINYPKNYGNVWSEEERNKVLKYLKKKNKSTNQNLFLDSVITEIATKLERTESGVKEEIKKMIFNECIEGKDYLEISIKYNICESGIKIIFKQYIDKYGKKYYDSIELENKLLKIKIENIKLKNELKELQK